MSLVHERLYQSKGLSSINMHEYIEDLASALIASYRRQDQVALKLDVDNIHFDIDTAVPCGLIINELMTNSLKYAFPDGKQSEVAISLRAVDGNIMLAFSDNGIGLPKGFEIEQVNSLGLKLFYNPASKQLHGVVKLDSKKGTRFEVVFNSQGASA